MAGQPHPAGHRELTLLKARRVSRAAAAGAAAASALAGGESWACSGPGAMDAIIRSELIGWGCFLGAVIVGVAAVLLARRYRRPWLKLWPVLLLILVHPGWWMSARSGDCGYTLRLASMALTFLAVVVAGLLVVLARRNARRPAS